LLQRAKERAGYENMRGHRPISFAIPATAIKAASARPSPSFAAEDYEQNDCGDSE